MTRLPKMQPLQLKEPKRDTPLRTVDFAWQAFQAGVSFARIRNGRPLTDQGDAEELNEAFRTWWQKHPQVVSRRRARDGEGR